MGTGGVKKGNTYLERARVAKKERKLGYGGRAGNGRVEVLKMKEEKEIKREKMEKSEEKTRKKMGRGKD